MADDNDIGEFRKEVSSLKEFMEGQFDHGRKHFERLEKAGDERAATMNSHIEEEKESWTRMSEKVEAVNKRLTTLEKAKIYFDGQKSGAAITIGATITAIVGAAIWIVSKMNPGP